MQLDYLLRATWRRLSRPCPGTMCGLKRNITMELK